MRSLSFALGVLALFFGSTVSAALSNLPGSPITVEDVEGLLDDGIAPERIAVLLQPRPCRDFALTADIINRLRARRANDVLIISLREHSRCLVVTTSLPQPPPSTTEAPREIMWWEHQGLFVGAQVEMAWMRETEIAAFYDPRSGFAASVGYRSGGSDIALMGGILRTVSTINEDTEIQLSRLGIQTRFTGDLIDRIKAYFGLTAMYGNLVERVDEVARSDPSHGVGAGYELGLRMFTNSADLDVTVGAGLDYYEFEPVEYTYEFALRETPESLFMFHLSASLSLRF
jgi:hypothetical protein